MKSTSITVSSDIAIVGFGFSGLMTLANLIARAQTPLRIALVADDTRGWGLAYSTGHLRHLLNVPAQNMGAWADRPGDFAQWLGTVQAASAQQALGLGYLPGPEDFAPRALYAQYLATLRHGLTAAAEAKGVRLHFHAGEVVRMARDGAGWQLTTAPGERIHATQVVLATGNEVRPIFPSLQHDDLIQDPWTLARTQVERWSRKQPVVVVGTGLTAVDTGFTLRHLGFTGEIVAVSRNGLLPQPHIARAEPYEWTVLPQGSLSAMLGQVRRAVRQHVRAGHDWRGVVDGLRPHTVALWQAMTARDQSRFVRRLATLWNVHRHRMAPVISHAMQQEIANGRVRVVATRAMHAVTEDGALKISLRPRRGSPEILHPAAIINCTGPELNWAKSARPLLQQLLQDGLVEPHATGLGVVADAHCRIAPNLYALGSLMTGQFWESTAVPELRQQAAIVAEALCRP